MTIESKSRQGSYTSVIAQCQAAMREANERTSRTIVKPCAFDTASREAPAKNHASQFAEEKLTQDVSSKEKSAQKTSGTPCATTSEDGKKPDPEALGNGNDETKKSSKENQAQETPASKLARVITAKDDEAVVTIAKSMVADTAASMVGNTAKTESLEKQLPLVSGHACSLYRPWDVQHLTDRQCYIRRELIEVYQIGSNRRVRLRCKFCHHVPFADRANGSEVFPRSLSSLCASVGSFQSYHLMKCPHIPIDKKDMYCSLPSSAKSKQAQQYWIESAKKIGLAEVQEGKMAGIIMANDLPPKGDDAVQSMSRYNRIKAIADEILSEKIKEAEAVTVNTSAVQSNDLPSKKRKRMKQGGRPRLLKLPVDPRRTCPEHMKNRFGRVGVYLPEARKERIASFHSKRKARIARFYSKEILYEVRRKKANSTKRKGGRFVKKNKEMAKELTVEEVVDTDAVVDDISDASAADDMEEQIVSEDLDTDALDDICETSTVDDDSSTGSDDVLMATIVDATPPGEAEMDHIPVAEVIFD